MISGAGASGAAELLERLRPFVVAPRWRFERLDLVPFGRPIPPDARFDVLSSQSLPMLERLVRLDRLTFGPEGMPMPGWLFVDGSALPGVITGLGLRAGEVPASVRDRLGFDAGPDELVPLAMYIAVPARPPAVWYGHNLASVNQFVPELSLRGLAGVVKALGLVVMRCTEQLGATQWSSRALHVHTRFGPLELLTAWTPAHADPATLTYRLRVTGEGLQAVLRRGRIVASVSDAFWVDSWDFDAIRDLEVRIEHGERFAIIGPPHEEPGGSRVPVAPLSSHPGA